MRIAEYKYVSTGVSQQPFIEPSVPSLISFWNAGFAAHRVEMIAAVESGAGQQMFLEVARSQAPLVELIIDEFIRFSHEGWDAIPGVEGKNLTALDKKRLMLFRDNALNSESFFTSMVEVAKLDESSLHDWYRRARHVYRQQPPLGPMIRSICKQLVPESIEYLVRLKPAVDSDLYLRDECFESARIAFAELVMNGIKFNRPGGEVIISNKGSKLLFSDNGIGMHPHFAMSLIEGTGPRREEDRVGNLPGKGDGWQTIQRIAHELGWWVTPDSAIDGGTAIEIIMTEANFHTPDTTIVKGREILDGGVSVFSNVEPFHGYRLTPVGILDVSQSPIFQATVRARHLSNSLNEE